jgi:hypothetical protein
VRVHAAIHVVDERLVEIRGGQASHFLLYQARAERIGAADFQHVFTARQHLGDELVTGQRENQVPRIVLPHLIGHEAQGGQALFGRDLDGALILRLSGVGGFRIMDCRFGGHTSDGQLFLTIIAQPPRLVAHFGRLFGLR